MEQKTTGITLKDKIGYALGDMGGTLFLGMIGSFLQVFYSNVLNISMNRIATLRLVLSIWDGINDPILGTVADRRPAGKHGKFRPYMRNFSIPFAIMGILMFTRIPGLNPTQYLIYAYIIHIIYEGLYTVLNIPLGSLASVMTTDGHERSVLSTFRSVGSGLGGLPAAIILPLFVYSATADGIEYLDAQKLFVSVSIFAVASIIIHQMAFHMITERVPPPPKEETHNFIYTIRVLLKNRPFLALCGCSMLLIGANLYTQTVYNYLYIDYFREPRLYSLVTIATHLPTVLLVPFIHKLVPRFGKKRLCAWGLLLSTAANTLALLLRTANPFVFMVYCMFSGLGGTFLNVQLWALLTDALDKQELLSGKREEGTCYSMFFFTRKLGHTAAGAGSAFLLGRIGFDENLLVQAPAVSQRIYTTATLVPALAFFLNFVIMAFIYPLGKKDEEKIREDLKLQRAAQEALAHTEAPV